MKIIRLLMCLTMPWSVWGSDSPIMSPEVSFELVCPGDYTVNCDEDVSDLSKFGSAVVWKDHKKLSAGKAKVTDLRNTCGVGTILRTWTVEDPNWKWVSCTQTITVVGNNGFTEADITWPESWTIDTCFINTHPNNLPDPYGKPKFNKKDCAHPAYSYEDEEFEFGPNCTKLIRKWKVIDWCTYDPNKGGSIGRWERLQVIKVDQRKRPDIVCPKDTVVYADDCNGMDVELEDVCAVSFCGDTLDVINTSPWATKAGKDASGYYPIGTHEFYYIVEYGCGRELKCKRTITVKSKKAPTPYCKNGIITTLMPVDSNDNGIIDDGMRDVWASDLNDGSYHSCDKNRKLYYSFSSDTSDKVIIFTCENVGVNEVEIWVTDEYGNQSFCITYIEVQNNNPNIPDCEPDSLKGGTISGNLATLDGRMIPAGLVSLFGEDARMMLSNRSDTTYPGGVMQIQLITDTSYQDVDMQAMSTGNGSFDFKRVPKGSEYEIGVTRAGEVMNGVDMFDAFTIYYHAEGFFKITDPKKMLAADVNQDNKIDIQDFTSISSALILPNFKPLFEAWRFVTEEYAANIPVNPFASKIEDVTTIASFDHSMKDLMIRGIKLGDLNDDADLSKVIGQNAERSSLSAFARSEVIGDDGQFIINMDLNPEISCGYLLLSVDGEVHSIDATNGLVYLDWFVAEDGLVKVTFLKDKSMEEAQITIKGTSNKILSQEVITSVNQSIVHDLSGVKHAFDLQFSNGYMMGDELSVLNISPNPFSQEISLEFMNNIKGNVSFILFDYTGKEVLSEKGSFDKGIMTWRVDLSDLPQKSTYFYRLVNQKNTDAGTIVKQ